MITSIKVGDRVSFQGRDTLGVVESFILYQAENPSDPFRGHILAHVRWDNGKSVSAQYAS